MLQPADLRDTRVREELDEAARAVYATLLPPRPCSRPSPSDGRVLAQRAIRAEYPSPQRDTTPTVVLEQVLRYGSGGASAYLAELRQAVADCPGPDGQRQSQWTLIGGAGAGQESVLIRFSERFDRPQPYTKDVYLVVARVREAIVVVADLGWESDSGQQDVVQQLGGAAAQRATTLR